MDIKRKVGQPNSQGNAASEFSSFIQRSCSWQYGRDAIYNDVEAEKREEDVVWGVVNSTEDSNGK